MRGVSDDEILGHLAGVAPFAALPTDAREELARSATVVALDRGDWLFRKGEPTDACYIVLSGSLDVVDGVGDTDAVLRVLPADSVLGELGILAGSVRSASIRVRRDARLIRIAREDFEQLLSRREFAVAMTTALARQLQISSGTTTTARPRARLVGVVCVGGGDGRRVADRLGAELERHTTVAVLHAPLTGDAPNRHDRAETDHDVVVLSATFDPVAGSVDDWTTTCLGQADRLVVVATAASPGDLASHIAGSTPCDVVFVGDPAPAIRARWLDDFDPRRQWVCGPAPRFAGLDRVARQLAGRSPALVLSGGGARGFAHIGVIDELDRAGVVVDRIGGTSMGAYIGAAWAAGHDAASLRRLVHEHYGRRNPFRDYSLPIVALSKGIRCESIMAATFGLTQIESLERRFFCVTVDILSGSQIVHDRGDLGLAVGGSMSIPGLLPPVLDGERQLVDRGLLNAFPVDHMREVADGPIIGVDLSEGFEAGAPAVTGPATSGGFRETIRRLATGHPHKLISLPDVISRAMTLGAQLTTEANRSLSSVVIFPEVREFGLLDWGRVDAIIESGRRAARDVMGQQNWLEPGTGAPLSPTHEGADPARVLSNLGTRLEARPVASTRREGV